MPSQKYIHPENPGALGFDRQLYVRLREEDDRDAFAPFA